jgi:hypothetical protein
MYITLILMPKITISPGTLKHKHSNINISEQGFLRPIKLG